MAGLSIRGRYKGASKVELVGKNGDIQKRKFYMEQESTSGYPNYAEFHLLHDNVNKVDELTKDQEIEVFFRVNGRKVETEKEGQKKEYFFQELAAYRIDKLERTTAGAAEVDPANVLKPGEEDDKLPF